MRPLKIAAIAAGTVGLILLGFLTIGFLLPSTWETERSIWIEAESDEVFRYLDSAAEWQRWTPAPDSGTELYGPDRGVGSGRIWDDPGYGKGQFEITGSVPSTTVEYRVEVEGGAIEIEGTMRLTQEEGGTRVLWRERGDFGRNPLLGYIAGRMEEMQGDQLDASLGSLRRLVEEGLEIEPES
ncbi:MAG: hypothetical protein EA351_15335 [Gemmatimonadales bacterium]|nr:MAG: hypothetical protein EA351_15335 [Gemmatimonadales bacterium]